MYARNLFSITTVSGEISLGNLRWTRGGGGNSMRWTTLKNYHATIIVQ